MKQISEVETTTSSRPALATLLIGVLRDSRFYHALSVSSRI